MDASIADHECKELKTFETMLVDNLITGFIRRVLTGRDEVIPGPHHALPPKWTRSVEKTNYLEGTRGTKTLGNRAEKLMAYGDLDGAMRFLEEQERICR